MKTPSWHSRMSIWVACTLVALTVCVFAPVLLADRIFAFRDAAHFYPPLWQHIHDQWSAGRIPLWNPYENLGQPLLAHPAAAICYPGQLVFLLPLPFRHAYNLYLVGHVLLAAATAYRLARVFRATPMGAGVSAITYAFSGIVLMQYTNPPFLVGAAWLPLAAVGIDRVVRRADPSLQTGPLQQRLGAAIPLCLGVGIPMALMVLGGDPQMAYNVGLLAALYLLIAWVRCRPGHTAAGPFGQRLRLRICWEPVCRASGLLGAAAIVALALSSVQVLPSAQLTSQSDRQTPCWSDRLWGNLEPGSHHAHTYHFSVAPWRLAELVWPNVSGRQYPIHRRWLEVIPAEGRVWTPTLYMGLFPLVLALSRLRFRRGPIYERWLTWVAVLATVASFGYYGLGWLLAECRVDSGVGGPFGGLYWLMNLLLPGYLRFRYPAKLLVLAALAVSVLAAKGWDRTFAGSARSVRRLLVTIGVWSLVGLTVSFAIAPYWDNWMADVPADQLFGPLDTQGAWCDLAWAFAQTLVLCVALIAIVYWRSVSDRGRAGRLLGPIAPHVAFLLVAVDLGWANAWLVTTVPSSVAQSESRFGNRIVSAETGQLPSAALAPPRMWRYPLWMPPGWQRCGSTDRLAEAMRFDRDTLWPNYNLNMPLGEAAVSGTMMLRDYATFLAESRHSRNVANLTVFDLASYAVLPRGKTMPAGWERIERTANAVLWHNRLALPRAWIAAPDSANVPRKLGGESCRVIEYAPERIEIEATLSEPGRVILAEQFYPGWQVEVSGAGEGRRTMAVEQADCILRAVRLPAGTHRLTFVFRPWLVAVGAAISAAGWLAAGVWAVTRRRSKE